MTRRRYIDTLEPKPEPPRSSMLAIALACLGAVALACLFLLSRWP